MSSFALEIWEDDTEKVTFYTVKLDGAEFSETDRFFMRMRGIQEMRTPLQELAKLIVEVIGNEHGAHDAFFNRFENRATALPPKGKIKITELELDYADFPLRLFCLRLSEQVVVLFNGGIKDSATTQGSTDVISTKLYEANEYAKKIFAALNQEMIYIDGHSILNFDGSHEIYL